MREENNNEIMILSSVVIHKCVHETGVFRVHYTLVWNLREIQLLQIMSATRTNKSPRLHDRPRPALLLPSRLPSIFVYFFQTIKYSTNAEWHMARCTICVRCAQPVYCEDTDKDWWCGDWRVWQSGVCPIMI